MKKTLIILLVLLIAGGLAWQIRPEYGSGYSEEQRRLWNERRELYPSGWLVESVSPPRGLSVPWYKDIANVTGKDDKATDALVGERRKKEEDLIAELAKNLDRSGPEIKVELPVAGYVSRLPLEGLTELELSERAMAGDGDACLMMAQYLIKRENRPSYELTWREKQETDKWLDRAIALKRPGAEFVKNFLTESWIFRKNNVRGGVVYVGEKPDTKKTPGRPEFMECLKKGDYLLYKTAACMMDTNGFPEEYSQMIHAALARGEKQGRAECQRNLAALCFDIPESEKKCFLRHRIHMEILMAENKWNKFFKWLPDSWKAHAIKGLFSCGVIGIERMPSMKKYREAARYARKAARQGDMAGMYWWVMSGITCSEQFSAQEWDDILAYSRVLLEAGYAPYIEILEKNAVESIFYDREVLNSHILQSYYSRKSYGGIWKKGYLESRGRVKTSGYVIDEVIDMNDLTRTREKVDRMSALGLSDFLLEHLRDDIDYGRLFSRSGKEVQTYLLEQAERWSAEGDINAMYFLADVYGRGIAVPADPGRACALLKRMRAESHDYSLMRVYIKNEGKPSSFSPLLESVSPEKASIIKMASLTLEHPDLPGLDMKEVYNLALDIVRDRRGKSDENYPAFLCYILGQYNERGLGRPEDREKALEFYKEGASRHQGCEDGVKRLSPAGS